MRSFSCFDEIMAEHSSCPIFCKVADLQRDIDLRDERIEQLQSDVEKKDEEILTLKASVRCREADIDFLQADAGYWHRQLENRLDAVRIACTNPLTPPISMCPDAIPMRAPFASLPAQPIAFTCRLTRATHAFARN